MKCKVCNGSGLLPIGEGIRGLKICDFCKGTGKMLQFKNDIPTYESTTIRKNEDGTYTVKHIFDDSTMETIVEYPRVRIVIDTTIDAFSQFPPVFPFASYEVLADKDGKTLFTITHNSVEI